MAFLKLEKPNSCKTHRFKCHFLVHHHLSIVKPRKKFMHRSETHRNNIQPNRDHIPCPRIVDINKSGNITINNYMQNKIDNSKETNYRVYVGLLINSLIN